MNEHLRDRVLRKLETLSDERAYQVLDFVEFLESKYAERQASSPASIFTRFSEAVEDKLRAGKVSASAIAETMGLMSRAMNVLNGVATGVAAAGRSVATDFERAAATGSASRSPGATPTPASPAGGSAGPGATGSSASTTGTAPPSGAPVAGSGVAGGAPPVPPAPAQAADQASSGESPATESGELDPPLGR